MNINESDDVSAKGSKYLKALSSLPEDLQPTYKDLVKEYKFHALERYGRAWAAYDVIVDLVRSGWRLQLAPGSQNGSLPPHRKPSE